MSLQPFPQRPPRRLGLSRRQEHVVNEAPVDVVGNELEACKRRIRLQAEVTAEKMRRTDQVAIIAAASQTLVRKSIHTLAGRDDIQADELDDFASFARLSKLQFQQALAMKYNEE